MSSRICPKHQCTKHKERAVMRTFSFRPSLTFSGREFRGIRGFAGKPTHPPLTDIPVGAYTVAVVLDIISWFGKNQDWSENVFHAATYVWIAGAVVSVFTALTGFWDWWKSSEKGTQVRRTINAHAWTMIVMTVLVIVGTILRVTVFQDDVHTSAFLAIWGIIIFGLLAVGATIGGSLTYEYGFNVENATDLPAYHKSETDVFHSEETKE